MAACSGCGEGDGGRGHGKTHSRTGLARVGGDVGSVADVRRQAGSGMARNRARARLNWVSQGQRRGRCRVKRRAERVSPPARAKNRCRRVLVVTIRSPRPSRAVQRARLCAITWAASQAALAAKRPEGRWFSPTPCQGRPQSGPLGRRKTVPPDIDGQHKCPRHWFREMSYRRAGQQKVSGKVLVRPILGQARLEVGMRRFLCCA